MAAVIHCQVAAPYPFLKLSHPNSESSTCNAVMDILSTDNYVWVCHLGLVYAYNWAMSARQQSRVQNGVLHLHGQLEENAIYKAVL